VKGWAIARLYPEAGLRPAGDIDICVSQSDYDNVAAILARECDFAPSVDLHRGFATLDDRSWADLFERSQTVPLDGVPVRVPCPEDHLRIACTHALRHGVWRPTWLCDVGVMLESRAANFDWDRCLGPDKRTADYVACAIGLAHQLVGAVVDDTPVAQRARSLPTWMVPTVLQQWGRLTMPQGGRPPMGMLVRNPRRFAEALRMRWPNGIEATVGVNGPLNNLPRWPFQLANSLQRSLKFMPEAGRSLLRR
jgi:hypothetical protein